MAFPLMWIFDFIINVLAGVVVLILSPLASIIAAIWLIGRARVCILYPYQIMVDKGVIFYDDPNGNVEHDVWLNKNIGEKKYWMKPIDNYPKKYELRFRHRTDLMAYKLCWT